MCYDKCRCLCANTIHHINTNTPTLTFSINVSINNNTTIDRNDITHNTNPCNTHTKSNNAMAQPITTMYNNTTLTNTNKLQ